MEWEKILFFAGNHDWFSDEKDLEWNIFNNNSSTDHLILSPNVYDKKTGDILAEISVECSDISVDMLEVYWQPGFCMNKKSMECFDNIIKWKADYTKDWLENKLLPKAQEYYSEQCERKSIWYNIFNNMLRKGTSPFRWSVIRLI